MDYVAENLTTFAVEPRDDADDRIQVEVGDAKQPSAFFPQTKLMRFDNQFNLSARLIDHEQTWNVVAGADLIRAVGQSKDIHFYEIEPSDDHPDGASELEIILKQKPATNTLTFSLRTKGLKFDYQPALTQDEIDEGCVRPDNIVGSYAVYAADECPNVTSSQNATLARVTTELAVRQSENVAYASQEFQDISTDDLITTQERLQLFVDQDTRVFHKYRNGKICHIPRPWIVDANGVGAWGDLLIEIVDDELGIGFLTVTIPQAFLDSAAYPVRHAAGLTFGYTTAGSTSLTNTNGVDTAYFSKGTPSSDGSPSNATIYADRSASFPITVKGVIWKVSDKTKIANGTSQVATSSPSGPQWRDSGSFLPAPSVSAGVDYYTGFIIANADIVYYDTGSAGDGGDSANNISSPTDLGTINNSSRKYSVYVTYTPKSNALPRFLGMTQAVHRASNC